MTWMSWFLHVIPAGTLRVLGLTLEHFLWEGAMLALVLWALTPFCRSAQVRYLLGVSTLGAMLLCPVVTFTLLMGAPAVPPASGLPAATAGAVPGMVTTAAAATHGTTTAAPLRLPADLPVWCAGIWLAGVILFSLRAFGGWLAITSLRRRCREAVSAEFLRQCRALEQRLGLRRPIRYLQSRAVESPSVIGWLRPVVLLPLGALSGLTPEQLEAVIVHELAHIRRMDALINLFQVAAETLFFYHPGVWWVNRAIRNERENCCDDLSVAICGNAVEYARALTVLETTRATPTWALSATGGVLKARVMRLLCPEKSAAPAASASLGLLGVFCAVGVLATAAMIAKADVATHVRDTQVNAPPAPVPVSATSRVVVNAAVLTRAEVLTAKTSFEKAAMERNPSDSGVIAESSVAGAETADEPAPAKEGAGSYLDSLKRAGLKDLSVDDLVALKTQGVTADYISEMRRNGLDLEAHDLISMKVQGITPEYVKEVRAAGFNPTAHELIGMKVQSVTPDYIRSIRATGLNPNVHELIGMKVQGVTAEYVRALQGAGLGELKVHDVIGAKVMGITPEFMEQVRSHGFKGLTLHQMMSLKNADVL